VDAAASAEARKVEYAQSEAEAPVAIAAETLLQHFRRAPPEEVAEVLRMAFPQKPIDTLEARTKLLDRWGPNGIIEALSAEDKAKLHVLLDADRYERTPVPPRPTSSTKLDHGALRRGLGLTGSGIPTITMESTGTDEAGNPNFALERDGTVH
jgi:hypothetical protein